MPIAIPSHMRAVQVEALSLDLSGMALSAVATPQPKAGDVLIRIEAAALGFPDLLQCQGIYQDRPPLPFIPGSDVAGTVAAIGEDVTKVNVGDKVAATRMVGGLAQYGVYPEGAVWPTPDNLSFAEAAATGAAYLTAYIGLKVRGQIEAGEWLLVHGAAGGVGLAAVDLGKALGAKVIAASTSESKLAEIAKYYKPDVLLNSSKGFRERVKEITGGGADVIYDPVGGDVFDESLRCIAGGGRLLVIGFAGGRIAELKSNIPLIKNMSVVGVRAGETAVRYPDKYAQIMTDMWAMAGRGDIRPHVFSALPMDQWREGFAQLESKSVVGRAVVLPFG